MIYAIPEFVISFDITIKQKRDGITLYRHEFTDFITESDVASGINKMYESIPRLETKASIASLYWFFAVIIIPPNKQYNIVKYIFAGI